MVKTFLNKSAAFLIAGLVFLSLAGSIFPQTSDSKTTDRAKNEIQKSSFSSINGRWAGYLSPIDSSGRIIIGMNIALVNDSTIIGNSSIQWPARTVTEVFRGQLDPGTSSLTMSEPQDAKRSGVYQCVIKKEGAKLKITGTWTRNGDNRQFACVLERVSDLNYSTLDPATIVKNLIEYIDIFCQQRDDDILKQAYSLWLSPETRLGEFNNFKRGFTNTLSDKVLPDTSLKLKGFLPPKAKNPFKNEEINGVLALVSVIHQATEYIETEGKIQIQNSLYRADYRLIVAAGVWKILSGKVKVLKKEADSVLYTVAEFRDKFKAPLDNIPNLAVINILPNPAKENDTITIYFKQVWFENVSGLSVFFDTARAVIVDDKIPGQVKCIVPGGTNLKPIVKIKTANSEGPEYQGFEITKPKLPWYIDNIEYLAGLLLILIVSLIVYGKLKNDKLAKEKETLSLETERLSKETLKLSEEKDKISANISQFLETKEDIVELADPVVPEELIKACNSGDCVLFMSSEISALGGYPNANDFVLTLMNWSVEKGYLTNEQRELLISSVKAGRYENAAENTIINLQSKEVNIADYIKNIYLDKQNELPAVFDDIKKTNFSFLVSANYENMAERAYGASTPVYTHMDTQELKNSFTNRKFFILKIYGKPDEPNTLILTPAHFSDIVLQNFQFAQFIENVFYSRTVFCIGANIEAIERFMNTIKVRGYGQQKHFALVGVKGKGWQTSADILKKRYGVEVIPYTYGNSEQLTGFMKKLAEAAPVKLEGTLKEQYSPIKKVILEDIGPFKKLELNLDNKWNVLLGDNGVGKSTILKAIAVGMCGDDAEPYAHRLIRNNSLTKSGAVTIITRKGKYITEIKDNVTKAAIKTNMRPIDTEGSLALGFPPLRTISWETKSETYAGKPIPLAEDILPIITGEVDPRMDKLKRWLVDLKGNATGLDPGDNRPKNKYTELIEKFFNIVDDLTPNLLVKYHQINTVSKQVLIETEDGIVPLEAISQGTLSLISWTGILLQRLYEVYSEGTEDPSQRYALVLMDELDAHMHPAWQRILIYKLKEIFPNIQFIVTTHSPLVVGGLPPEQIFKFQRTEQGSIVRAEVSKDDTVGRANQILTSNLFGLEVSLDVETEGILNEYKELAKNQSRTPEEEEKYKQLKREIKKRVGSLAENPDERNAQRRLEAWNIKQTSEIDQDEIDETIKYLEDSKKKQ